MQKLDTQNNKCLGCGHDWIDLPGSHAECYMNGCPQCGSLYWVARETESLTTGDKGMKIDVTKDWCVDAAEREDGCEVGAGKLADDLGPLVNLRLELTAAQKELKTSIDEIGQLQLDRKRLDYLESEPMDKAGTLFRQNMLITRQRIDKAMTNGGSDEKTT